MTFKRKGASVERASKKAREMTPLQIVENALTKSDAMAADVQKLFAVVLAPILSANKVDRHAYEVEVVDMAQQAVVETEKALMEAHIAALAKQAEITAPKERENRAAAQKEAEEYAKTMKGKLGATANAKNAAEAVVLEADAALKVAKKELVAAENAMQKTTSSKTLLTALLANELTMLKGGTSASNMGKKAVQTLLKVSKEYGIGNTLQQAFALACKKEPVDRSEFEATTFTTLQARIETAVANFAKELEVQTVVVQEKQAAVAASQDALDKAKGALATACDALAVVQGESKEATKRVSKAGAHTLAIWDDMKQACQAQDKLAHNLKYLKESVWPAFEKMKEMEPAPEHPEPTEEAVPEAPIEEAMPEATPEVLAEGTPEVPAAEATA
jgi:hypothetical protein